MKKVQRARRIKNIPPNSPLGEMLENWNKDNNLKSLDKIKMIKYCVEKWPNKCIEEGPVYWPWCGTRERWLCVALNRHLKLREFQKEEEIKYMPCWLENDIWDKKVKVYETSKEPEIEKEEMQESRWDPLDHHPPPPATRPPSVYLPPQIHVLPPPALPAPPTSLPILPSSLTQSLPPPDLSQTLTLSPSDTSTLQAQQPSISPTPVGIHSPLPLTQPTTQFSSPATPFPLPTTTPQVHSVQQPTFLTQLPPPAVNQTIPQNTATQPILPPLSTMTDTSQTHSLIPQTQLLAQPSPPSIPPIWSQIPSPPPLVQSPVQSLSPPSSSTTVCTSQLPSLLPPTGSENQSLPYSEQPTLCPTPVTSQSLHTGLQCQLESHTLISNTTDPYLTPQRVQKPVLAPTF